LRREFFLQVASSSIAQAQAPEYKAIIDLITNTADRICYVFADKGSASSTEVRGAVNVELSGLASRLAGAGVKGTGSISNDEYSNVLREDVGGLIRQSLACKERVFNSLLAKLLIVTPPVTESKWNHNGSTMSLSASGEEVKFYYFQPRAGIIAEGVKSGTLLFSGQISGDRVFGTAYLFDRRCAEGFPYRVSGDVMNGMRKIVMSGQAPTQFDFSSCRVIPGNYRPDTLVFDPPIQQ
jgi:hypothetical protein